jgi:hypothetical protein
MVSALYSGMRVFTLLFGIILAAGPAVVGSQAQTPAPSGETNKETGKSKHKNKAKHNKTKKPKKEKGTS